MSLVKVLAVGAHPDDVELGCGGALLAHSRAGDDVALLVMTTVFADGRSRIREQEEAAGRLSARLFWGGFRDGDVPNSASAVAVIEAALESHGADLVYTHWPVDTHQDHRATASACLAASRKVTQVLCYESPTSMEFSPTVFVDVTGLVNAKLDLIRAHMSQVLKNGLVDLEAAEAQARFRGSQARIRHAEGFQAHRFAWDPTPTSVDSKILDLTDQGVVQ